MYKYILFDLDGTISDSGPGITKSVQHALNKMGIEENDLESLKKFVGPPLRDSFKRYYDIKPEDMEKCIGFYRERYSTIGLFENEVYEGIPELVKSLYDKGFKPVLASSKPRVFVEKILEHFGILQYFYVVMGSELDGSLENKIDIINACLEKIEAKEGIRPDVKDCVMIGDRLYDIEAANALGMPNIGVTFGFGSYEELEEYHAGTIVESVEELSKALL